MQWATAAPCVSLSSHLLCQFGIPLCKVERGVDHVGIISYDLRRRRSQRNSSEERRLWSISRSRRRVRQREQPATQSYELRFWWPTLPLSRSGALARSRALGLSLALELSF
eukprot:1895671-Pleurochrysis_carterae.AAC.1